MKLMVYNKEFYYKVNNNSYRKLKLREKQNKKSIILSKMYIDSITVNARIDNENNEVAVLMYSFFISELSKYINIFFDNFIKIDNINFNIIPFNYEEKFYFDIDLVLGIKFISSMFDFIRFNITSKGEEKVETRGNDRKYA